MQVIERMFERAIEQFGGDYQAAIEYEQGPPHGSRSQPEQCKQNSNSCERLLAQAHFSTPSTYDAMPCKAKASIERLVFHE